MVLRPPSPLHRPFQAGSCDVTALASWSHACLKGELQVGGVFVRVFNAHPSPLPHNTEVRERGGGEGRCSKGGGGHMIPIVHIQCE